MIEKLLNLFFVKKTVKQNITYISSTKREKNINKIERVSLKNYSVETCLSKYFISHRGLNLIERGHVYVVNQRIR